MMTLTMLPPKSVKKGPCSAGTPAQHPADEEGHGRPDEREEHHDEDDFGCRLHVPECGGIRLRRCRTRRSVAER